MKMRAIFAGGLMVTLAACGGAAEPKLLNIRDVPGDGPDEFAILPAKPLVIPDTLDTSVAALPEPTPGGANLADIDPDVELAVALGGSAAAVTRGGADPALIAYTTRFGVAPGIRSDLAASDLAFRRENDGRLLERIFNVNVYYRAYEPFALDQYAELERFRRAGVRTPAVPPPPEPDN